MPRQRSPSGCSMRIGWVCQRWPPELQALQVNSTKQALDHAKLVQDSELHKPLLLTPYMIHKFHARRPLTSQMSGVTTFVLVVSNREEGAQGSLAMPRVALGISSLQMIGVQLRRETLHQSPLASSIHRTLSESAA